MNKKGYTLIEIIAVIALIAVISVGSIVGVNVVKNNKVNNEIYDKLSEAASVFLSTEKDEKGNTYENGLLAGGVGVTIPIQLLDEKGYLTQEIIQTLEKEEGFEYSKSYLTAAIYSNDSDECDGNMISFIGNWQVSSTEPTYICPYENKNIKPKTLYNIIIKEFEENGKAGCTPGKENGLCMIKNENNTIDGKPVYYFTGDVDNNYVKLNDHLFFIMRTTEDGDIKLIDTETIIPESKSWLGEGDFILKFYKSGTKAVLYNSTVTKNGNPGVTDGVATSNGSFNDYYLFKLYLDRKYEKNDTYNFTSWNDDHLVEYKCTSYCQDITTKTENSIVYKYIYLPVKKWYEETVADLNDIILDYNWCDKSVDLIYNKHYHNISDIENPNFICNSDNNNLSKFGLLTIQEYDALVNHEYRGIYDKTYSSFSDSGWLNTEGFEITFDFSLGLISLQHLAIEKFDWYSTSSNAYYNAILRPSIVIDGDALFDGEGTIDNPYVLLEK